VEIWPFRNPCRRPVEFYVFKIAADTGGLCVVRPGAGVDGTDSEEM